VADAIGKAGKADGELSDIRKGLIAQYSGWLKDLDEKCRLTITIATALLAIAAKQVLDERSLWSRCILGLVIVPSLLSMLYGIRGYTSRSTSRGGLAIATKLRQWIAYLFGRPAKWLLLAGDEIAQAKEMRGQTLWNRAVAHRSYFLERYGTENPEVIQNLRIPAIVNAPIVPS
jgi:hypothetical protein